MSETNSERTERGDARQTPVLERIFEELLWGSRWLSLVSRTS